MKKLGLNKNVRHAAEGRHPACGEAAIYKGASRARPRPSAGGCDSAAYSRSFAFICGFCFLLLATIPASAENPSPQAVLMVANVAGECDVLYSMVEFQKKNNITGGNEYVAKFWASESAKMNLTVEQLSDRCGKSITAYDKLQSPVAPKQAGPANGNE
jgi:hypothetical protein